MELTFASPGLDYSLDSIMGFQDGQQTEHWSRPLFHFFPQIDRARFQALPLSERRGYLKEVLTPVYSQEEAGLEDKLEEYNSHWRRHKAQIVTGFSEAFGQDYTRRLNHMVGNITLNPICPRFLDTTVFDVFYLNSHRGALGIALHEMVHFAWFDRWQTHFGDHPREYETPHLKWIFSEMVVDPIFRKDKRLHEIDPYYADGSHVYGCFHGMKLEGKPVLETLYAMYCDMSILDFMEQGLAYCQKHEEEIRGQMTDTL